MNRPQQRAGLRTLTIVAASAAAIFVVLGIGAPLLGQRAFIGTDYLQVLAPWQSSNPPPFPTNFCVGDTIDAGLTSKAEFRNRVWNGDFPLWNPAPNGGSVLGAVPDSGMLSPLNVPYLLVPLWLAPGLAKFLELSVAIGFTFLFLRRLGFGRPAASLAGLIYASSGFLVVWTNWPQSHVAALVPALFWAVERYLQVRTIRAVLPISAVMAVMLLEGFPAVTGWSLYAVVGYLIVRGVANHRTDLRRIVVDGAAVAGALILGLGVAALQVVPFLFRLPALKLAERAAASGGGLPSVTLATLPVPQALGTCGAHGEAIYWGPLNDIETNGFVGVVALLLLIVAVVGRRPRGIRTGTRFYFLGAAALTAFVLYLRPWSLSITRHLPVFDINPAGRLRFMLGFCLAVLAAVGFEAILNVSSDPQATASRRWRRLATVVVGLAAFGVAAWVIRDARALAGRQGHLADFDAALRLPVILGILAIAAVAGAYRLRGVTRTVALALLPMLAVVQSLAWVWPFWPRVGEELFYPETEAHEFLQDNLGGERFVSAGMTMYPATSAQYGLRSVVGHSFVDPSWEAALLAIDPDVFLTRTFTLIPSDPSLATSSMLDRLATRYFVASAESFPVLGRAVEHVAIATGSIMLRPDDASDATVSGGGLRGVGVTLAEIARVGPRSVIRVELVDHSGAVVARGSRLLADGTPPGDVMVPVPGEDAADGSATSLTARVTLEGTSTGVEVRANAMGEPALLVQRAADDGLSMVFGDGVAIYERTRAVPRIRWAGEARSIEDADARLQFLSGQPASEDVVILSTPPPESAGGRGSVEVLEDSGDVIRVRVEADGAGHLVVADALTDGWVAEVDGAEADLVPADEAGRAVFLVAGAHEVVIRYEPRGWLLGLAITAVAVITWVGLWVWGDRRVAALRLSKARHRPGSRPDRDGPTAELQGASFG